MAELHAPAVPDGVRPTIWLMEPTDDALVLGSRQRDLVVSAEKLNARDLSLVHRRSGGGAVLIDASTRWLDVLVPADGPAWGNDLTEAFRVVGESWQRAFAGHGIATEIWNERPTRSARSDAVCFAGMGWGELALEAASDRNATKVLGLSQRRTRWGARIQCMIVNRDHTSDVADMLDLAERKDPADLGAELFGASRLDAVVGAFLHEIASL